jgi:DNA-binding HxlR family transcriptional regulator
VGERWTLLIVRNLLVGGPRYKDLLETLPGITTNLLAERLKHMVAEGLIAPRELAAPANAVLYELTERGRELEAVVLALGRFGAPYLASPKRGDRTHVRWAMVSFKRRYRGSAAGGCVALSIEPSHHYRLRMRPETLEITEGAAQPQDEVRARLSAEALRGLLFKNTPVSELLQSGQLVLDGRAQTFHALAAAIGAHE